MATSIYSTDSGPEQPIWLSARSSKAFVTLAVSYAVFAEQFLFAVIVPVMPFSLHQRNDIAHTDVQYWISILLATYGLAAVITSPIAGWWSDYGSSRQTPFFVGLGGLFGATVLLWLAPNITTSIVARLIQGGAATLTWVAGLAVMADTIGEAHVGEYMGYIGIALNLSTFSGPMLGGIIFDRLGYHSVFYMTFGVIAIDLILRLAMIERGDAERWSLLAHHVPDLEQPAVPSPGAVLGDDAYSTDGSVSSMSADSVDRQAESSTAWTLLTSSRLLTAFWGIFVQAALFSGFEAVLPVRVDALFDWSSFGAGLIFLPLTLPSFLGPAIGKISDRIGARWPATFGFLLICPALVLLRLIDHDDLGQKVWLCVLLAVVGLCITMTLDPLMAEITYVVSYLEESGQIVNHNGKGSYAQAYGLFSVAWSLGNMIGPMLAGLIGELQGWETMSWVLGLLGGVSALPVAIWCGGSIFASKQSTRIP